MPFSLDSAKRQDQVGVQLEAPQGRVPKKKSLVAFPFCRSSREGLCWGGVMNILEFRY